MTTMRLRHTHTAVQITVPDDKAQRLIADGTYKAVPDAEQPPPTPPDAQPSATTAGRKRKRTTQGPTSIAAALKQEVGPLWDTP
nr:hypothetical protein [Williamsia sterculiae]